MTLIAGELSLNVVLTTLGYRVVNHRKSLNGQRHKSIVLGDRLVRFPEGTIPGRYTYVTNLSNTTASIVWAWLRATEQIK